jgi:hypothetical protein
MSSRASSALFSTALRVFVRMRRPISLGECADRSAHSARSRCSAALRAAAIGLRRQQAIGSGEASEAGSGAGQPPSPASFAVKRSRT